MAAQRRGNALMDEVVADADAARAIERQMAQLRERVQRGGVMEYLVPYRMPPKPLGGGERKDVNKVFLSSTIRSVDSHNRRHEEEKCWKIRELERKLDDRHRRRHSRSRSRSVSPGRRRHDRGGRRNWSRSRSRSRGRDRDDRDQRRCRRSRSRSRPSRSSRRDTALSVAPAPAAETSDPEREYWAAKKAKKTKKMWEAVHAGTTTVLVANAPEFSSDDDDSDDEDERVHSTTSSTDESKKTKKKRHEKKEKKHKRNKKRK